MGGRERREGGGAGGAREIKSLLGTILNNGGVQSERNQEFIRNDTDTP